MVESFARCSRDSLMLLHNSSRKPVHFLQLFPSRTPSCREFHVTRLGTFPLSQLRSDLEHFVQSNSVSIWHAHPLPTYRAPLTVEVREPCAPWVMVLPFVSGICLFVARQDKFLARNFLAALQSLPSAVPLRSTCIHASLVARTLCPEVRVCVPPSLFKN